MTHTRLIVFIKNPVRGRVKTRLAATIGDDRALAAYHFLLRHTRELATQQLCDKIVYYSDRIPGSDDWSKAGFRQALQSGNDLGERMLTAFEDAFNEGYRSVIIIGSDCFELSAEIVSRAFDSLTRADVVLGPAHDGGYYLLGMTHPHVALFQQKAWSTPAVLGQTRADIQKLKLTVIELETLHDIDTEDDLIHAGIRVP